MTTRTAFEIEGFIVDTESKEVATHIGDQRIDQAIFQRLTPDTENISEETRYSINSLLNSVSTEEFSFHFEVKNQLAHADQLDALADINQIICHLRSILQPNGLDIVFQPFLPVNPHEFHLTEDHLTDNARDLMRKQKWTMSDMRKTIISGFQINRDIPQQIIQKGLALDYTRNLYNFTADHYQSFSKINQTTDRLELIEDLLVSADKGAFPDNSTSYAPGGFATNQDMQEYFQIKTKATSLQDKLQIKRLHSLTIKPKGPESTIANFIPSYIEWRLFDSIDISTPSGFQKAQEIIQFVELLESFAAEKTLTPSSNSGFQRFPMVPHPLDRTPAFHPAE